MSSGSGVLTIKANLGHQERLLRDPDFDSNLSQLSDSTQFAKVDITAAGVRLAARKNIVSPRSRRAMVVKNDLPYGCRQNV